MKFLLEFVSCCGCHESYGGADASSDPESPSESSTLVPVFRRSYRRRRKGRTVGDGRSAGEWKPSLFAIAEDNVVMERQRNNSDRDRVVKRKTGDLKPNQVRVRSFSNDFGQNSMPIFAPAFSPTPFMF